MTAPRKTAGMVNLTGQLTDAFPDRQLPDGWIGDQAHQGRKSSHNPDDTAGANPEWQGDPDTKPEVRAVDASADLGPGVDPMDVCRHLAKLPKLATVVRYFIHNGLIWHSDSAFTAGPYSGTNAHTKHIHFTGAYSQYADENTTFDYRFEEVPVKLTSEDKAWIRETIAAAVASGAGPAVWNHQEINPQSTKEPKETARMGGWARMEESRASNRHDQTMAAIADIKASLPPVAP